MNWNEARAALRDERIRRGLTQAEVARLARTHQSAVSEWEAGTVTPSIRCLILWAAVFDLEVGWSLKALAP